MKKRVYIETKHRARQVQVWYGTALASARVRHALQSQVAPKDREGTTSGDNS